MKQALYFVPVCLSVLAGADAAEVLTYTLAPESTITLYSGGSALTEPLKGSFDWVRCPGDYDPTIGPICFDATRLDFESPSFSIHLSSNMNNVASSVLVNSSFSYFDEIVDVTIANHPLGLPPLTIIGAALSSGVNVGTYVGSPERPTRLSYYPLLTAPGAVLRIVAFTGPDSDGDGVPDAEDQCPDSGSGVVVDEHGCTFDQLVPCAGPASGGAWKNHGEYVSALNEAAGVFLAHGLITAEQRDQILQAAASSACGKK